MPLDNEPSGKKTFRIHPKMFEIISETNADGILFKVEDKLTEETTWENISPIEKGGLSQENYSVEDLFELPLQESGQILWDKGITTIMSGANKKEGYNENAEAHILIDFDKLSEENKLIAEKIGEISNSPFDYNNEGLKIVNLKFTIGHLSPWEVKNKMKKLANSFNLNKKFKIISTYNPKNTIYPN